MLREPRTQMRGRGELAAMLVVVLFGLQPCCGLGVVACVLLCFPSVPLAPAGVV